MEAMTKARSWTGSARNLDGGHPNRCKQKWAKLASGSPSRISFCVVYQLIIGLEAVVLENLGDVVVELATDQQLANQFLRLGNAPAVLQLGIVEVGIGGTPGAHLGLEGVGVELLGVLALFAGTGTCRTQPDRMRAYSSAEMQRISHSTGLPSSP